MRESIGTVSLLNFIMFFILLIFAFLAGTLSYYKAYKVNNAMVAAIEKYEGMNQYSYTEIQEKLGSLGYIADESSFVNFSCASEITSGGTNSVGKLVNSQGNECTNRNKQYQGYCIYRFANDTFEKNKRGTLATTDKYDTYEVITYVRFKFPVIENLMKLKVASKTGRIYQFN